MGTSSGWSTVLHNRLTRRRALAATGASVTGAAFLAACGGNDGNGAPGASTGGSGPLVKPVDTSKQAMRGGVIKDSRDQDISNFDPHNTRIGGGTAGTVNYFHQTSSLFLRRKPGHLEPTKNDVTGDAAESWEWSPDGLKLTMKLRRNGWAPLPPVNGRAVTVDDVKWTMNRFFAEGSNRADYLNALNPDAAVTSLAYPDANTFVWNLAFPFPGLLSLMASTFKQSYLMPVEAANYDIKTKHVGSGPFYLADYKPSASFKLQRNPNWWDKDRVYVDGLDIPIISEYAAALSQFRAGNLYRFPLLKQDDVLPTKRDVPQLLMYTRDLVTGAGASTAPGWNPSPADKTPFRDERVRQAYSMALDRDAYIDAIYNTPTYESAGLKVEKRWNTALLAEWDGYWLDPQDLKAFGPNAKFYKRDLAEAKKLLAAAGYANGLDVVGTYPATLYGASHVTSTQILIGMALEAGIRIRQYVAGDQTDWPGYRDGQGHFEGIIFRVYGSTSQTDPIENLAAEILPTKGNLAFSGFDADGKGTFAGDPVLTEMLRKARAEFDDSKRREQGKEIQRYWAKRQYTIRPPGGASSYELVWPVLKNNRVYQGPGGFGDRDFWLDPNEAPLKKT